MSINTEIKTGNPIVDEIGMLNLSGNVIPETWYQTIVSDKGKVNCLAILVLSDIVYWYRPQECRNETDLSVRYVKRFHDDEYLQRSYEQICSKFNISKKQARDSIVFLESLGVIKRHFKDVQYANGAFVNLMFIELIPSVLKELTFPEEKGVYKNVDTPLQKDRDPSTKKETPPYKNVGAYTKNTTEITTEITSKTTPTPTAVLSDAAECLRETFAFLNASDKDITSILTASGNNVEKCKRAAALLKEQTSIIRNPIGWLIKMVGGDCQQTPYTPKGKSPGYYTRDIDFDELEREWLTYT